MERVRVKLNAPLFVRYAQEFKAEYPEEKEFKKCYSYVKAKFEADGEPISGIQRCRDFSHEIGLWDKRVRAKKVPSGGAKKAPASGGAKETSAMSKDEAETTTDILIEETVFGGLVKAVEEMTVVPSLPVECSICLGALGEDDTAKTRCGHTFHLSCIAQNIRKNGFNCPNCRGDVVCSSKNFGYSSGDSSGDSSGAS